MRLLKVTLLGVIVAGLAMMWSSRDYVIDAYSRDDDDALQVTFSGIDLDVGLSDVGPSPYLIPSAKDTRWAVMPALSPAVDPDQEVPPVELNGGEARFAGTITNDGEPVHGATIAIERLTSDGIGEVQVRSNAVGRWGLDGLQGGRYRVRSWVPGQMTSGASVVRFVADNTTEQFNFELDEIDPTPTIEFVHGGAIFQGSTGSVAVAVNRRAIDQNGVVVSAPINGWPVSVQTTREVSLRSSSVDTTNSEGVASFTLRCNSVSSSGVITVTVNQQTEIFRLPGCRARPTTTTTTAPPPRPRATTTAPSNSGQNPQPAGGSDQN